MKPIVLAFGELLWDLLPSGPVMGGAPANFAFRIHSLGDRGVLVSRLGRDKLGQAAFSRLTELGMETSYVQWEDLHPTGTVQVELDAQGNPDFTIVPEVAYDQIQSDPALLNLAAQANCLCFGTLVQRAPRSRRTLQLLLQSAPQAVKLLDLNLRKNCYSTEIIVESLRETDILKLNENEVIQLAALAQISPHPLEHFASEAVQRWELSHCLITLGRQGALVAAASGEQVYSPGYKVAVADTCGSGDACTAGFLHGLLHREPLARCLQLGNALGALVAAQAGATEVVTKAQLDAFLSQPPERVENPSLARWIVS